MNSIGWVWLVADRHPDRIRSNRHLDRQSDRDRSSAPIVTSIANLIAIAHPLRSPKGLQISCRLELSRCACAIVSPRT